MSKVIIFGVEDTAELAHYYLENDSEHEVVGFSLTGDYMKQDVFKGLPVTPFEELENVYSPPEFTFFAPMQARNMNKDRERIFNEGKSKGYEVISYISSRATVFPDAVIGSNCFILEDNTIQPFARIGNNVVLWSGNHIGHHGVIKDHVFFSSHVVLSGNCVVEPYCYFGVNSTIRDFLNIGEGSFIGMGANVTKDTKPFGVYYGNPAKKIRETSAEG